MYSPVPRILVSRLAFLSFLLLLPCPAFFLFASLYASLFFFLLLCTSVSLHPTWFSGLCRFRCSYPVRAWLNIRTVCAIYIAVS